MSINIERGFGLRLERCAWRRRIRASLAAVGSALIGLLAQENDADCSLTTTGNTPLPDMGLRLHEGFEGGLYPGGRNSRPVGHEAIGLERAQHTVQPLDADGNPDPANGKIVFVSVGMSNTSIEFTEFVDRARVDPATNPRLVLVDGAQGGHPSSTWVDPESRTWEELNSRLAASGVTPAQVQVAWVKQAQGGSGPFPSKAQALQADLENIARNLKLHYPNIQLGYFSSRTRAYTLDGLSPEPTAYETGFAVKWMIENQLRSTPNLDLTVAPWLSWGPYLWTDGTTPRSDGFIWECSDTGNDFTHPSSTGRAKVAEQLAAFFKTDPTATPWYVKPATASPVIESLSASPQGGSAGITVQFTVSASDTDGVAEYLWTFDDGTFAVGRGPSKIFYAAGDYEVQLAVIDRAGNATTHSVPISVGPAKGESSPLAVFSATPQEGAAPLDVLFDASASSDPDGIITSYVWDFGDGSAGSGSVVTHTYVNAGSYQARLMVQDDDGRSALAETTITVTDPSTGLTISSLSAASGRAYAVQDKGLTDGAPIYVDKDFAFGSVPALVEGATYIQTAYGDRSDARNPFLNFDVDTDVRVYVGHDDEVPDPSWLDEFNDTGFDVLAGPVTFDLYARDFPIGTITLGGNVDLPEAPHRTMYIVVVVPSGAPESQNPGESSPSAVFSATPQEGAVPLDVLFDAGASADPDGTIISYVWDFGDGSAGSGSVVTHTYVDAGDYQARLMVQDDDGRSALAETTITVTDPSAGLTISNLSAASGRPYAVQDQGLTDGATIYVDKDFAFGSVPKLVEGATYIQTAFGDRSDARNPFLNFNVDTDVRVYVGHDEEVTDPSWLDEFTDTGADVLAGPVAFDLYARDFPRGTITLGGNVDLPEDPHRTMYIVVVVPFPPQETQLLAEASRLSETSPASTLQIDAQMIDSGQVRLLISGSVGYAVEIQASLNLADWETIGTAVITPDSVEFRDRLPDGKAQQFYRLVAVSGPNAQLAPESKRIR